MYQIKAFWFIWLVVVIFDSILSIIALWHVNVSLFKDLSILCYSLQAYFIAYHLLKKPRLFFSRIRSSIGKYRTSNASGEQLEALALAAQELVEKHQLYLNPNLRQQHLAEQLQTNTVVLSQMLDTTLKQNFNEWISHYRVAHARKLIAEGYLKVYSVDALAEASGYGSRVSFYRNFKRVMGKTPVEYEHEVTKENGCP